MLTGNGGAWPDYTGHPSWETIVLAKQNLDFAKECPLHFAVKKWCVACSLLNISPIGLI